MPAASKKNTLLLNSKLIKLGKRCPKALYFGKLKPKTIPNRLDSYYYQSTQILKEKVFDIFPKGQNLHFQENINLQWLSSIKEDQVFFNVSLQNDAFKMKLDVLEYKEKEWRAYVIKKGLTVKKKEKDQAHEFQLLLDSLKFPKISFNVLYLNKNYTINNGAPLLLKKRIVIQKQVLNEVKEILPKLSKVLQAKNTPEIKIGAHCYDHGLCEFHNKCFEISEQSVFDLRQSPAEISVQFYQSGVKSITAIPETYPLTYFQRKQREAVINNQAYIATGKIASFIEKCQFPIAFIDFEGYQTDIPELDNHRPMAAIPFLFSAHILTHLNQEPHHFVHINDRNTSTPEKEFAQALLEVANQVKSFVVYNHLFEFGIINQLIALFPEYKDAFENIKKNTIDLQTLFERPYAYHPDQKGAIHLKAVSEAFAHEKVFENSWIKNGLEASRAYEYLPLVSSEDEKKEFIDGLRKYCAADTSSLYLVWKKLYAMIQ